MGRSVNGSYHRVGRLHVFGFDSKQVKIKLQPEDMRHKRNQAELEEARLLRMRVLPTAGAIKVTHGDIRISFNFCQLE